MIRLDAITLRRGPEVLLEGTGLTVHPGQKIGLVGANGSGKSSLFAALVGGLEVDAGRFMVRRRRFRLGGVPHRLLVLAEVGGVLSAERSEAWQGLVRVMSHEINNSLSPIKSMAETWQTRIARNDGAVDTAALSDSLELISRRAGALSRFVGLYAGLAKLPEPDRRRVDIARLAAKVVALETRLQIRLDGEACTFDVDADQLEQALINLVRNAVEACADRPEPDVVLRWRRRADELEISVIDNGPGPPDSANLFVPFFTTKPGGSGIGLADAQLGDFDVLILPDTREPGFKQVFDEAAVAKLKGWVERGGVLVTLAGATRWAAAEEAGLLSVEQQQKATVEEEQNAADKQGDQDNGKPKAGIIASEEEYRQIIEPDEQPPEITSGVLVKAIADRRHWLAAGVADELNVLVRGNTMLDPITLDKGNNVVCFAAAGELVQSGYLWPDSIPQLAWKPFVVVQPEGQGMIIGFSEDPNVRAYLNGLNTLFMNAVLRAPAYSGKIRQ